MSNGRDTKRRECTREEGSGLKAQGSGLAAYGLTGLPANQQGTHGRQKALVARLLEEPAIDLLGFTALFPKVPRRTLERDLQQAVAKRVVVARGATNRKRYRLNDKDL